MAGTTSPRPALSAWAFALLLAALVLPAALGGSPATSAPVANAQGEEGRYSALVFSRTTGFRHTAAINAGHAALDTMAAAEDFDVAHSEDAGDFTSHNLRNYDVVVFLNTDGEGILNAQQRIAFERWTQNGGGAVRIHGDANADKAWEWKTHMQGGGTFSNHPPIQEGTLEVADATHPATADLPATFTWTDEWYNFDEDPRENVHVLLTVDESTYEGGEHGAGHPIAWCSEYDGGRNFYTAIGHADGGATPAWSNENYLAHISGALEWAAGEEPGNCGPARAGLPTESSLEKVSLDEDVENPMSLDVANDGRVFFVELGSGFSDSGPADVKLYDPVADQTSVVATLDVLRRNENGLLGIALDPNFDTNNFLYLFYSVPGPQLEMGTQNVSRFTFDPASGQLDMESEVVLLEIPHQRLVCCHSSGSLAFGPDGNLYASVGDDDEHARSGGYSPHDDRPCGPGTWNPGDADCTVNTDQWPLDARHANDSRRTSGNTNDLRGKILRIDPIESAAPTDAPGIGSTYEIPEGNLFSVGTADTRPEIYSMGHRNPFRFTIDDETGWIYQGEVGPDANNDSATRGPRGYDEINQIREAGNFGWPYCIADNKAYRHWDFATNQPAGDFFDCENGPANDSPVNTGQDTVPPGEDAWIYYPYGSSPDFPDIPTGSGRTAIAGPVYNYDPDLDSDIKLSEFFDGKLFWGDWSRDWMSTTTIGPDGEYAGTDEFMPNTTFRAPQDIELGPDGAIYLMEWGFNFNYGGQFINLDAGLFRIEQRTGGVPALAQADAAPTFGAPPLEVNFSGELSDRGADDAPSYEWDFGDGETSTEVNPTHTYNEVGEYEATLTVTDEAGQTTDTVTVNVADASECGDPRSDEFDGDALDAERWEVVREDSERLSVSDGALNLVAAPLDIFGNETGMPNIVLQPLPGGGSAPWSLTAEMTWDPTQNFQNAGLIVYSDDDNYIKTGMVWNGSRNFELIKESAGSPTFEGDTPAGATPDRYFMRYVSTDGTSLESQFSADGTNWTSIGTTDLTGLESPRVGVYATASTQPGAGQPTASFHSVSIEPDRQECSCFSDEFEGAELDPKWTMLRSDPAQDDPAVADGSLTLPLGAYGFDMGRPGPISVLGQPMPEGDWEAVAKIDAEGLESDNLGQSQYAKAGLMVFQESTTDADYHWLSFQQARNADGAPPVAADSYFEATAQNGPGSGDWTLGPRTGLASVDVNLPEYWIRITRTGNEIAGDYAIEDPEAGGTWVPIPASNQGATYDINAIMPPADGPIYVGAYGANGAIDVSYDYVRMTPDVPCPGGGDDTTPPVTTHALDPENPGQGGTYDGPVDVNLSATDPGEGGGEPQTHDVEASGTTWTPDEVDLALGDDVRWNFPSETAGFPHDVWLVPPGGDPDPGGDDIVEVTDGLADPGDPPVSQTFEQEGAWTFLCRLHSGFSGGAWSGMVGTAEVAPGSGPGEPSGVAFTERRVNTDGATGEWVQSDNDAGDDPFETSFTVAQAGDHVVEYRSVDNAGNEETTKSVEFAIAGGGNSPPVINSITADPDEGDAPLEVDFAATASDPDDDPLTYSWDFEDDGTGDSTEQSPTHTYTEAGVYEAELTVSDGTDEVTDSVTVTVIEPGEEDTTPPVTTVQLNGAAPVASYDGSVTATFTAADPGAEPSGVDFTQYSVDGGAFTTYNPLSPPAVSAAGEHTIEYRSEDLAGNVEDTQSVEFEITAVAGEPDLDATVAPASKTVGAKTKQVGFRFRVANTGDGDAGKLRLCAAAPKRMAKVVGGKCQAVPGIAAGEAVREAFKVKPKRALRGKRARIRFTASGQGVPTARAVATLKVRR